MSELKDLIPLQDAIDKTISDTLLTSEFGAAPQRWGIGFEPPKDAAGNVLPMVKQLLNRLWVSEIKDTLCGQFPQASTRPYVDVTTMLVTHFACSSRTPAHYFFLDLQFPTGD